METNEIVAEEKTIPEEPKNDDIKKSPLDEIYIERDSQEYEFINAGLEHLVEGPYIVTEIGIRQGGSAACIFQALEKKSKELVFVGIDQYGLMPQIHSDTEIHANDYSNSMRNSAQINMLKMAQLFNVNYIFLNMSDEEYMQRYYDYVPVYNNSLMTKYSQYSFVHFDGPHSVDSVLKEVKFFTPRSVNGAIFVFDDIENFNITEIENWLYFNNFRVLYKGKVKLVMQKRVP